MHILSCTYNVFDITVSLSTWGALYALFQMRKKIETQQCSKAWQ